MVMDELIGAKLSPFETKMAGVGSVLSLHLAPDLVLSKKYDIPSPDLNRLSV